MAFIPSHQELARHPKTRKAARLLGVSLPTMLGHLHLLWYWAMDYARDGDLSPCDPAELAEGAGWDGDPARLLAALMECGMGDHVGFIERTAAGTLVLHDWHEYGGKLHAEREATARRVRTHRRGAVPSAPPTGSAHPDDYAPAAPPAAAHHGPDALPDDDARPVIAPLPAHDTAVYAVRTAYVPVHSQTPPVTYAVRTPQEERRLEQITGEETTREESGGGRVPLPTGNPTRVPPASGHPAPFAAHGSGEGRRESLHEPEAYERPLRLLHAPTAPLSSPAAARHGGRVPSGRHGGEGDFPPAPPPRTGKPVTFCPSAPTLPPDRLAREAAAIGTDPDTLAAILPQWADARLGSGKRAADWYADCRKFARSFLEHARHDAARTHGAGGGGTGGNRPTTRAPSTDKYTVTAIEGSLGGLDTLLARRQTREWEKE